MSRHVVISGATGFIGAAILRDNLRQGNQVTVLLRPDSDCRRLQQCGDFGILRYAALAEEATISGLKALSPEVFIHCAWKGVGGRDHNQDYQITENLALTLASVELAAAAGCRQWIGLGSQAEYGNLNVRISEEMKPCPTTLYGRSKLAAGIASLALCEARGLTGAWLRVFSTYGPGDAAFWFLPYLISEFTGGRAPQLTRCEQFWDYLYVDDAACAVSAAVNHGLAGVYNLGSGIAKPLKDYVEAVREALGSSLQPNYGAIGYRPDQVMHLEADISRLTEATGWKPAVSFQEGIALTVDSFLTGKSIL